MAAGQYAKPSKSLVLQPDVVLCEVDEQAWYTTLINDCRLIISDSVFSSRWVLIEGYWLLGNRILAENDNFDRAKVYGKEICSRVSKSLGRSRQTLNRAIQFARKFPTRADLDALKEIANITWHKVCNNYLPEHRRG